MVSDDVSENYPQGSMALKTVFVQDRMAIPESPIDYSEARQLLLTPWPITRRLFFPSCT